MNRVRLTSTISQRRSPLRGARVLIVEDELMVADRTESMLLDLGCEVLGPVPDAKRALRLIAQDPPDVAVLDINLGDHFVFEVAEECERRGIAFIFATGYDKAMAPERFATRRRLHKPFEISQLENFLVAALTGKLEANCSA